MEPDLRQTIALLFVAEEHLRGQRSFVHQVDPLIPHEAMAVEGQVSDLDW